MFGRFCSATRCHALVASGESRMPTPLDPLFEVCSWPAPRKVYPLGSEMNSSDCPRHVSERQMANALRHCAVWTSSVRRESVFNPRQFCANMCSRLNFLAPEDLGVAVSSGAQVTARVCETRCVWVACWRECRWEGRRRNDVALSGQAGADSPPSGCSQYGRNKKRKKKAVGTSLCARSSPRVPARAYLRTAE